MVDCSVYECDKMITHQLRCTALLVWFCSLLGLWAVEAQLTLTDVEAVSESYDFSTARINTAKFTCLVYVNNTDTDIENETTPLSVRPQLLYHNDVVGDIFTVTGECQAATVIDLTSWSFTPVNVPKPTSGDAFTATWNFCYRSSRGSDDFVMYRCQLSSGVYSAAGRISLQLDGASSSRGIYFGMAPFVFVFTIIFLCNIVLWRKMVARRHQHYQREAARTARLGETNNMLAGTVRPSHTGLSTQAMACIPIKEVPEDGGDLTKELCVICQCEYQPKEKYKQLNCSHIFHAECIDSWLAKSSSCPICISEVTIV